MPRIFRAFLFFTFDYTFTESILYEIVNSIYIPINSNSAILGLCDINFEIFMGIFLTMFMHIRKILKSTLFLFLARVCSFFISKIMRYLFLLENNSRGRYPALGHFSFSNFFTLHREKKFN